MPLPAPTRSAASTRWTPTPDAAIESKQRLDDLRGAFRGLSDSPPPDPRHARVRGALLRPDRRSHGDLQAGRREHSVPGPAAPRRGVRRAGERPSAARASWVWSRACPTARAGWVRWACASAALMTRHLSHCESCHRHARLAGLDDLQLRAPSRAARGGRSGDLPVPLAAAARQVVRRRRRGPRRDHRPARHYRRFRCSCPQPAAARSPGSRAQQRPRRCWRSSAPAAGSSPRERSALAGRAVAARRSSRRGGLAGGRVGRRPRRQRRGRREVDRQRWAVRPSAPAPGSRPARAAANGAARRVGDHHDPRAAGPRRPEHERPPRPPSAVASPPLGGGLGTIFRPGDGHADGTRPASPSAPASMGDDRVPAARSSPPVRSR